MRLLLPLSSTLTVLAIACAAPTAENAGDPGEDLGSTESLETVGTPCSLSKQEILDSVSGGRRTAISRGFEWLADNVPYSQSAEHEDYRTDCSGFVSMCWQLGTSFTTSDFNDTSSKWKKLASYDALVPGDAIVRRVGGEGHIVLFVGWNDANHKGACVLEEASTANDMQFRVRTVSSLKGSSFKPIAAVKLASSGPAPKPIPKPTVDPVEPDDPVEPVEPDEPTGASCTSDGICNPGGNGSGKICVSGHCVSGCHSDAQCPGITSCVSGQCQ